MGDFDWHALQNGSDIRGVATEGAPDEDVNLTPERVERIARSFVSWLSKESGKHPSLLTIAIGRDSRISGPALTSAFASAVLSSGASAVDCGLASTPAMFMSTVFETTRYDGGVMITASHLPFNRNGIKFFTALGGLDKDDIRKILDLAAAGTLPAATGHGLLHSFNLMDLYSGFLVETIRKGVNDPEHYLQPLLGFDIVVDAGNGSGGFYVDRVLNPLGANTTGSRFLEPDGMFPNHAPNPEDDKAIAFICDSVLKNKADIGIIFDTDVDRAAMVDKTGNPINRNLLIGLVSAIILDEHPGTTVVTDSITSDGLAEFINGELGGIHHRFKRGYKNVINEAIRLNNAGRDCWLAVETSGHAALRENHFLDDGAFLVTKILIRAALLRREGRDLGSLIGKICQPVESTEYRIKVLAPDFKEYGSRVIGELGSFVGQVDGWSLVPDNHEGIRIKCAHDAGDGWFLLRLSLHDPVMPLNIESNSPGGVSLIAERLSVFFSRYDGLENFESGHRN